MYMSQEAKTNKCHGYHVIFAQYSIFQLSPELGTEDMCAIFLADEVFENVIHIYIA